MSMFAFILLLLSGTNPDRRSRMWASDHRWAEAAVGGPGESGEEGIVNGYLTCFGVLISGQFKLYHMLGSPGYTVSVRLSE